jgi:hypothetical protein
MEVSHMIRQAASVTFATLLGGALLVASLSAATNVTFVMKNGQRIAGTFSYDHTDHYTLIINGQQHRYPSDDIAMVAFTVDDPTWAEVDRLPNVDNPPELERHTLVLRNGEMIRGKVYDFQGDTLIMDVRAGDRRTYNMSDIARLYVSAPGARGVYKSASLGGGEKATAPGAGTSVRVEGNRIWTDSGITVTRGENLTFAATGKVKINKDLNLGPDGDPGLAHRRSLPMQMTGSVGSLIGRIGNGQPFTIGSNTAPITMPATGKLLLGINDDNFSDNGGAFDVTVTR